MNNFIAKELDDLNRQAGLRYLTGYSRSERGEIRRNPGESLINLSSNDYLGLSQDERVVEAACQAAKDYGAGSSSSRLVTGTLELHERLEVKLANWLGAQRTLVYGSGFHVNIGVISALLDRNSLVLSDKIAHASLIDGCRLSGATLKRFRHNDIAHLEELLKEHQGASVNRTLIVTESVFSMDGDLAPIEELKALADQYNSMLLVDEAHALGVFGAGLVKRAGLLDENLILTGTMSKAFGSFGGVVACSENIAEFLINKSRAFIYSTALPPASIGASLKSLQLIESGEVSGVGLLALAAEFREGLAKAGFSAGASESHIVPLIIGENEAALEASRKLEAGGVLAYAMRPPTVPSGQARIRFSLTAAQTSKHIAKVIEILS